MRRNPEYDFSTETWTVPMYRASRRRLAIQALFVATSLHFILPALASTPEPQPTVEVAPTPEPTIARQVVFTDSYGEALPTPVPAEEMPLLIAVPMPPERKLDVTEPSKGTIHFNWRRPKVQWK